MSKTPRKGHVSHERWLISYSDFITLLFALFVVLFAFAKADHKRQADVAGAVNNAFSSLGLFPGTMGHPGKGSPGGAGMDKPNLPMNIVMGEDVLAPARVKNNLELLQREMQQTLSNQVATHSVSIKMGQDGLVISLREAGFFNTGSATPKPEALPTLRTIATALSKIPYDVRIEGHTDNVPIHTAEFDSNWELSAARATHIARFFVDTKEIAPDRLSAAGYAGYHPVASNETAAGRAQNRRVDLVILPRTVLNFAAPDTTSPTGAWRKITDDDSTGATDQQSNSAPAANP